MEEMPRQKFSLANFIEKQKREESEYEYTYGDPGAPAHNLELMLKKISPERGVLVEKILDPTISRGELYTLVDQLDKLNSPELQEEGLYEPVCFGLSNGISIDFRLFQNGLFIVQLPPMPLQPPAPSDN